MQAAFCLLIADGNRNDTVLDRLDVLPVRLAAYRLVSFMILIHYIYLPTARYADTKNTSCARFSVVLPFPRQPETFTPPQTHPPSFPHRRESWLGCGNIQINKQPPNPKQNSCLHGNDGVCCFSDGFSVFRLPQMRHEKPTAAPTKYGRFRGSRG